MSRSCGSLHYDVLVGEGYLDPLFVEPLFDRLSDLAAGGEGDVSFGDVDAQPQVDEIGERLGMLPPWRQWRDRIAPISAKAGEIEPLKEIIRSKI